MKLFYQPEQAVLGDVIPFYDDGKFKPFYLKNTRGKDTPSNITGWTMLTTEDHLHFTEHPTYISGGTGSVIKVNDTYRHLPSMCIMFSYSFSIPLNTASLLV